LIEVGLQCCHDPSTTRAGANEPSAGKNRPAPVGMTLSRDSRMIDSRCSSNTRLGLGVQDGFAGVQVYGHGDVVVDG
jgi:hypothetical protein